MAKISKDQAVRQLWKQGVLHWKLQPVQKEMYDMFHSSEEKVVTWLCSRRIGKSFTLSTIAIEECLKNKNTIVKFLCPTASALENILIPIFREILKDCPESLVPDFIVSGKKYRFKNGSEIHLAGSDNKRAEKLRGTYANLCIVDEAGFCDDLGYTVRSILKPLVLTTKGKIILSSTPPRTAEHDFVEFINLAEDNGSLIKRTIFDNKMITPAEIQQEINSYLGGMQNPEFRREYLAELIMDKELMVFPEFNESIRSRVISEHLRPGHFDYYVAADIGFIDYTAVLFAYLDFTSAKLVIEDEILINKNTTKQLADSIKEKESQLLYNSMTGEQIKPHIRVSDTNLIVINDLAKMHGINFVPTRKDDRDSAINNARLLIEAEKIIIHPRCKNLISHLKSATWKNTSRGREIARSKEGGHYDAAMAFVYLIRNINWNRNPYPKGFFDHSNHTHFNGNSQKSHSSEFANSLVKQYKRKKSI